ncbi:unnamed protein product [Symbiodinium sp. CCMP2592]|nr:unnamed protein product [Symbiodinium sp. CCMP2592]
MAMRPLHAAAFSSLAPARRSAKQAPPLHRTFLVPSASIPCWPEVDVERLAGAPRLDTLCRCIAATFHLGASSEPRSDSSFLAAFAKPSWTSRLGFGLLDSLDGRPPPGARPIGAVQVSGQHLRVTGPSERNLGAALKRLLEGEEEPGWSCWEEESLRSLLHRILEARGRSRLLVLREDAAADASEELALAAADESTDVSAALSAWSTSSS